MSPNWRLARAKARCESSALNREREPRRRLSDQASAVELPAPESAPAVDPVDEANLVKAPMVGTFYRSSDPESKPFAEVGDSVAVGQTLCIIEAMKLMNEIPAPYAGVVRSVAASNGEAVGFGDPLFVIERA